jgi:hypothetical protein
MGAGSHVAPLATAFMATLGPVLECGTGWWSTPLLHGMAAVAGRPLVSLENDQAWFVEICKRYSSPKHVVRYVEDWNQEPPDPERYDLAFVDFSPGDKRVDFILSRLKGRVDIIVAHDVEADIPPSAGAYGWVRLEGAFKYERIFKDVRPWTAIWSDTVDVRRLFS